MSYYLKYTGEGREAMWYMGNMAGWKPASYLVAPSTRSKPTSLASGAAQRLAYTFSGLLSGEIEIVWAPSGAMLAEAVKDSINDECVLPGCQGAEGSMGDDTMEDEPQNLAIAYIHKGERTVFMRKDQTVGNKIWLTMRELREAGDLPKQFRDAEAIDNVEASERNIHVDTGGHYRGVVTEDMAGMTWEGTARGLAGMLNQIADTDNSKTSTKAAFMETIGDIKRQAGEMLDILQMRNEDEDD